MTAWVVRGGRNGEREADALEKGVLTIGFGLVEDLRKIQTKEDAKRLLRQTNPERNQGQLPLMLQYCGPSGMTSK